jgi:uncharacterized damage-inducible protein DinB
MVEDGGMGLPFPSPTEPAGSRAEVLLRYLDYFRAVLVDKVRGLDEAELRRSRLPSGWTPVELVRHLTYVERRWLVWGFEGREVGDPWGDRREDRWYVEPSASLDDLVAELHAQAETTGRVVRAHDLEERGAPGERWEGAEPATLERVLLHLVQEYARHVGHIDIVRELADGVTGK